MRRLLGPVCVIGLLLSAGARAQPAALPLELSWQAPSECPAQAAVQAELSRIVRARPGRVLRPLAAEVVIRSAADGYRAALRTEHEGLQGERDLHAQDCATLARSVTLVLALAFGPDAEVEPEASSESAPQTAAPSAASTPAATAPAEAAAGTASEQKAPDDDEAEQTAEAGGDADEAGDGPGDERALRLGFLIGGGVETGLFPTASAQLQAGVALELSPAMLVQLRASALPAVSEPIASDARASFDGLAASALGCSRFAWLLSACAGARVAALRARGFDLDVDGSAVAPWYALLATLGATWPSTGPLRIGLEAALAVSLSRPRFAVKELDTVHRVPLLAPELSVLLELWP